MAEIHQDPMVKTLQFKTTYERLPIRGSELDDDVDEKGFKIDAKGKRLMSMQEVDWVKYAPAHSPINTNTWQRVKHMRPTEDMLTGEMTEKVRFMSVRWSQIEPHYQAWKTGNEVPLSGTPLAAWPGCTTEKAEVLKRYSIRTVEEVANLTENQLDKVPLPGMREMKRQAAVFLDNKGAAESAQREADRDNTISALQEQLAEQGDRLAAAMELLERRASAESDDGEVERLRAELDEKGIKWHPRAGAAKLREMLSSADEDAA